MSKEKMLPDFPLFSMCSLYPKDKRTICACFLSKDSRIVEDMRKLRVSALMWSAMGSGVISLNNLEEEGWGRRIWDPQGRSDVEFIRECKEKGINVFSVVFTAQGVEVGISTDEKEERIISFGRIDKKEGKKYWGLNEFYQNRYPKIFKGFKNYFKDIFYDDKGNPVKDFINETACCSIDGKPARALWVNEIEKYFDMKNYYMCKNSPYWRDYLKRIVEMQIEAGSPGIQFDESGGPLDSTMFDVGFCPHCTRRFSQFLSEKYGEKFRNFDYRKYLRRRGYGLGSIFTYFKGVPYGKEFKTWHLQAIRENLKELTDYTRDYAKQKEKEVLIAGNYVELLPFYFPVVDLVDILNFELMVKAPHEGRNSARYMLARELAREKPVTAVPSIMHGAYFKKRKKDNLDKSMMKYFVAEAAASQANFQIPYSCLTIEGEGSYYPDLESLAPYQNFIANHSEFYLGKPVNDITIIFSFPSYFWEFEWVTQSGSHMSSFLGIESLLSDLKIPYHTAIWGDGKFVDEFHSEIDSKIIILPAVSCLTEKQRDWLENFSNSHGKIAILGSLGRFNEEYDEVKNGFQLEEKLLKSQNRLVFDFDIGKEYRWERRGIFLSQFQEKISKLLTEASITTNLPVNSFMSSYISQNELFIHIVNSQYEEREDRFLPLKNIAIEINKEAISFKAGNKFEINKVKLFRPEFEDEEIDFSQTDEKILIKIKEIPLYGVISLDLIKK